MTSEVREEILRNERQWTRVHVHVATCLTIPMIIPSNRKFWPLCIHLCNQCATPWLPFIGHFPGSLSFIAAPQMSCIYSYRDYGFIQLVGVWIGSISAVHFRSFGVAVLSYILQNHCADVFAMVFHIIAYEGEHLPNQTVYFLTASSWMS